MKIFDFFSIYILTRSRCDSQERCDIVPMSAWSKCLQGVKSIWSHERVENNSIRLCCVDEYTVVCKHTHRNSKACTTVWGLGKLTMYSMSHPRYFHYVPTMIITCRPCFAGSFFTQYAKKEGLNSVIRPFWNCCLLLQSSSSVKY